MLGGGIEDIKDGDTASGLMMAVTGLVGTFFAARGIWRVWWDVFRRSCEKRQGGWKTLVVVAT